MIAKTHRRRDYIVISSIGNFEKRFVWNDTELLPLDHPKGWTLGKVGKKIYIFDQTLSSVEQMEATAFHFENLKDHQRLAVNLPPAEKGLPERALNITLVPLVPLKPPYMQTDKDAYANSFVPRQLMLYQGIRYFLLKYRPVGSQLTASTTDGPVFTYAKVEGGYSVTAHKPGLVCKLLKYRTSVPEGVAQFFTEEEFFTAVFTHGLYWWRFRAVQTPESMAPIEREDSEEDLIEQERFENTAKIVVSVLVSLFFLMLIFKKQFDPPVTVSHVALQAPKVIPHPEIFKQPEPPKPPPPIVEEKPEPEKPIPPEPPKKKVVKKEKPKPEKAPRKIVKEAPIPPPQVARQEKPEPVRPPPAVKAQTPPATGVVTKKTEEPPVVDQSAQVLQSLSFLSTNSKASAKGAVKYDKAGKKSFTAAPTLGGGSKDAKLLDSMSSQAGDTKISTKSSRTVSSDVNFGGKGLKGLNDVQGKVAANEIYGRGSGSLGSASGISMSGPGTLSESEIEKALAKFASKFQFCYEKSLMSDSTLGGNVRLQWNIDPGGGVSAAKVVQSQMNNTELHNCILGVLRQVPFPSPKGGSVTAKKTFNFKSSSL